MQRLSASGHSTFCVDFATQLFQTPDPNVEEVKWVLGEAAHHGSIGAKYFLIILDVLAEGGFSVGSVFRYSSTTSSIGNWLAVGDPS